jgi:hypothetical protein
MKSGSQVAPEDEMASLRLSERDLDNLEWARDFMRKYERRNK